MKIRITIYFILAAIFCNAQSLPSIISSVTYDRSVRKGFYPNPNVPLLKYSVNYDGDETPSTTDLRSVLNNYVGNAQQITIKKIPIAARTGQGFYIAASNTNVDIQYTTPQSLDNAIYSYLSMLGITWYGAGSNWFVKPDTLNAPNIAGQWIEPTFRARIFREQEG